MKYSILTLSLAIALSAYSQTQRVVPSNILKWEDSEYILYPNGVLDALMATPAYMLEKNDKGLYPEIFDKVAIITGTYPGINTIFRLTNDFEIPESIEAVGKFYPVCGIRNAFESSTANTILIPDCVSRIEKWSFKDASSIEYLTLPASLNFVGEDSFVGMGGLKTVYCRTLMPPSVEVSDGVNNHIYTVGDNYPVPDNYLGVFGKNAVTVMVPKGSLWFYKQHPCFINVRLVEYNPEWVMPSLKNKETCFKFHRVANFDLALMVGSTSIPSAILNSELQGEDYVMEVSTSNYPYRLTQIGESALRSRNLNSVYLPKTIELIAANAFEDNVLSILKLPSCLKAIGPNAFANCKIEKVVIENRYDNNDLLCAQNAFDNSVENAILYIDLMNPPVDTTALPWSSFKEIRDISEYSSPRD